MSNNFAVSGSITSNLASQIAGLPASTNLKTGLFTVVTGGNDFFYGALTNGITNSLWSNLVANAVWNISNGVCTLYTNGACEIIVGNLVNVGLTPSFIGTPAGYSNYVDTKVASFNTMLGTAVTNAMQSNPGLHIYLEDRRDRSPSVNGRTLNISISCASIANHEICRFRAPRRFSMCF